MILQYKLTANRHQQFKVSPEPSPACGFAFAAPFPCYAKSPPALARLAVAGPAIATTSAAASIAGVRLVIVVG